MMNISDTIQPIFIIFTKMIALWVAIQRMQHNYDLKNVANVSEFCLYLSYPFTNFNVILSIIIMNLRPAKKIVLLYHFENVSQGHHFTKIAVYQQIIDRFLPNFHSAGYTNVISADLEVKVSVYKNHYISAIIWSILTKRSQIDAAEAGSKHSWPWKCMAKSHFTE